MELSIIIPVYNGAATINRCLDSIYSQGLSDDQFETICVDDCSPDPSSVAALENYQYDNARPNNLIIKQHTINKRQGGARNTGIAIAKGEWILFIDQDDFFIKESLGKCLQIVKDNPNLDFIMVDCVHGDGKETPSMGDYTKMNLDQTIMTGSEFLQKQPVPWCPWCYIYDRKTLLDSSVLFAENVRFEDADFVLKYTAKAKKARFHPWPLVYHVESKNQTSHIGANANLIRDYFKMSLRIYKAAAEESESNTAAGKAILGHAVFMRKYAIQRYLWRIPYTDILSILQENRFARRTKNPIVDFSNQHIKATALLLTLSKPMLRFLARIK